MATNHNNTSAQHDPAALSAVQDGPRSFALHTINLHRGHDRRTTGTVVPVESNHGGCAEPWSKALVLGHQFGRGLCRSRCATGGCLFDLGIDLGLGNGDFRGENSNPAVDVGTSSFERGDPCGQLLSLFHRLDRLIFEPALSGAQARDLVLERFEVLDPLDLTAVQPSFIGLHLGGHDLRFVLMATLARCDLDASGANSIDLQLMLGLFGQRNLEGRPLFEVDPAVIENLGLGVEPLQFEERFLTH